MIDINDYKLQYQTKDRKVIKTWIFVLLIIIIGIFFINKSFKYYKYYTNKGEYQDKYLNLYVLIDDLEKITKNNKIYIENKKFAYKIEEISSDNIYLNNNYYKKVKISINNNKILDNEIVNIKIITEEYSLLEYVFKTVWR